MKYYYEYKYKSGCKVGGHNLEKIEFYDNYIKLLGVDIIQDMIMNLYLDQKQLFLLRLKRK